MHARNFVWLIKTLSKDPVADPPKYLWTKRTESPFGRWNPSQLTAWRFEDRSEAYRQAFLHNEGSAADEFRVRVVRLRLNYVS